MKVKTFEEVETNFTEIKKLTLQKEKLENDLKTDLLPLSEKQRKIQEKHDQKLLPVAEKIAELEEAIESFAVKHKKEIDKKKELRTGVLKFVKSGKPAIKIAEGVEEVSVIGMLKKLFRKKYVRTAESINRSAILDDYPEKVDDKKLDQCGLFVEQKENFKYEIF